MAEELNNIGLITVLLADTKKSILVMANDGMRQNTTGIIELADIPVEDDDMHTLSTNLIAAFNALHTKPPTGTKAQLNTATSKYTIGYNKNALYIQTAARDAAILAGNVNVGIQIVEQAGFFIKSPKSSTESGFSGQPEGGGIVKVTTKAVAPHCIYIRQYGMVTEEGVVPEKTEEPLIGSEATIFIEGVPKKGVLAIREAYMLPITRKAEDSAPETQLEKKATLKTITSAHRRVFNLNDETHYKWGPWIWITAL